MNDDTPLEDLNCPVCMSIFLDPTTLNCGHTVCRGCLAGWYLSQTPRRDLCPTCRRQWEGCPQINTSMRNFLDLSHPKKIAERRRDIEEHDDYNFGRNLIQFESELKQRETVRNSPVRNQNFGFFSGVVVAILAALVVSYLFSWGSGDGIKDKGKGDMPVATWKSPDVAQWLTYLGWARNYSDNAKLQDIDGVDLLNKQIVNLMDMLNVTDKFHRNALELAVLSLRESGLHMPQTIWEYKALYPGRSLYISQGMKDAPRCAMLFMYLFYYEDCFLPFLHATVPRTWDEQIQLSGKLPNPTVSQCLMFVLMMLVFPYGMMGLFAWSLRSAHTLSHLVVMLTCFLQTILELNFFSSCLMQGQWRHWRRNAYLHAKTVMTIVGFMCMWQVLPSLVASVWFYCNVYYTPVTLGKTFYQIIMGLRH